MEAMTQDSFRSQRQRPVQHLDYKQAVSARVPEFSAPRTIPDTHERSAGPDSHSPAGREDTGRVQARGQNSSSL
jgi:hypothetical protein